MVKTETNKAMNASALPVPAVTKSPDATGCAPVFLIQPFTSNAGAETPCIAFDASCKCQLLMSFVFPSTALHTWAAFLNPFFIEGICLKPPVAAFSRWRPVVGAQPFNYPQPSFHCTQGGSNSCLLMEERERRIACINQLLN